MSNAAQDFMNFIANHAADWLDPRPQEAIKNGPTSFTPQDVVHNAINDVGGMATGLLKAPGRIVSDIVHPDQITPDLQNLASGVGQTVNNALGHPVNPETGKLQVPSAYEAAQNLFQHPVNTAALLEGGSGILKNVGKTATTGLSSDMPALDNPNFVSEGMKAKATQGAANANKATGSMNFVPKTDEEIAAGPAVKPRASQNVADTFLKQFTVPAKVADRLDMQGAAQTAINDGISPNLKSIQKAVNTTTGATGEFSNLLQRGLKAQGPVSLDQALKNGYARINEDVPKFTNPTEIAKWQTKMQKIFPTGDVNNIDTLDAWNTMKKLEEYGYSYLHKSTYLTSSPEMEDLGNAFIDTAKDIENVLDTKLQGVDMSQYETPQMRENLSNLSPQLLARYDAMPKTIRNVRAIQKPYVDLGEMLRQTNAASHTAFSNASEVAAKAIGAAAGGTAGIAGGPLGTGVGAFMGQQILGPVIQPIAKAALEKYMPDISMGAAKAISNAGGVANMAGNAVKGVAGGLAPLAALESQEPSQQQQGNISNGTALGQTQPLQPEPPQLTNIPQDMKSIHPFQWVTSPTQMLGADGSSLAISPEEYQVEMSNLQAQKEDPSNQVWPNAGKLQAKIDSLDMKYKTSQTLNNAYEVVSNIHNQIMEARSMLSQAPTNLLSENPTYDKLLKAYNGKYAVLAQDLQAIEGSYPKLKGTLLTPHTTDVATQALDNANRYVLNDYFTHINAFTGGASQPSNTPYAQQQLPPQVLPSAGPQGLPAMQSGSGGVVQATAPSGFAGVNPL